MTAPRGASTNEMSCQHSSLSTTLDTTLLSSSHFTVAINITLPAFLLATHYTSLTTRLHSATRFTTISDKSYQSFTSVSLITSKIMATNESSSNSRKSEQRGDQHQSRLEAVRMYEGDGAGAIINDFYSQQDYSKRRLGFLGRHPDYTHDSKLLPKVRRDIDEVFHSKPATLSVQQIRQRELDLDIDPLLPLPTSSNTQTLDDHSSYPTTEWAPGMLTDQTEILQQARPFTSPSPPPLAVGRPDNDAGNDRASGDHGPAGTAPTAAGRIDSVRSSPKLPMNQLPAFVSGQPARSGSSTQSNVSDSNLLGGDIDQTQQTANTSPDRATTNTSKRAAATGLISNVMADTAVLNPPTEAQLKNVLDLLARPIPRDNGIGAVVGRAVNVPVKSQGTKRTAPPETDETGERTSETAAPPPPPKKVKLSHSKASSTAGPATASRDEDREDATMSDSEAAAAPATASSSSRKKPTATTSKSTSDDIPISSNAQDVATGLALPETAKTALAAQKLRRHHLTTHRKSKKRSGLRTPDLKPEFWLKENITKPIEIAQGPVRCVCGLWGEDDGTQDDEWAGCEKGSCQSWQHVACVGEAYKGVMKRYWCHQCDPYAHRVVLRQLRAGEEVRRPE